MSSVALSRSYSAIPLLGWSWTAWQKAYSQTQPWKQSTLLVSSTLCKIDRCGKGPLQVVQRAELPHPLLTLVLRIGGKKAQVCHLCFPLTCSTLIIDLSNYDEALHVEPYSRVMAKAEHFDVVVVGAGMFIWNDWACISLTDQCAGFSSLGAAKVYMQCAPETNLIILDSNKTVGGVWSEENIYPGLRTNNHRGTLEFPDYPFPDDLGANYGEHLPGEAVHQYLVQHTEKFDLAKWVRFQTTALEAEKTDQGWRLLANTSGRQYFIETEKLIVGTGLSSRPQKMRIKSEETYNAPFLHAGALAREAPSIAKDPEVERVTIYGGSKFAWDTVYTFASSGKEIDWVIRKSGHGPTWMANIFAKLPIIGEVQAERLVTTRFMSWLSPFPWVLDGSGWWRYFLQRTWLGQKIMAGVWYNIGNDMQEQAGFQNHPSLKALYPDCGFFDTATSLSILNYPEDILEFVRSGQVKVYREDISHLSDHTVHLANGDSLKSDALIASTGWEWQPTLAFKDTHLHSDLGIPSCDLTDDQKAQWAQHDAKADAYITQNFPHLLTRPSPPKQDETLKANPYSHPSNEKKPDYTPVRLYRTLAPPGLPTHDLAFVGFGVNISGSMKAELTGLWIYAYLNDLLSSNPSRDEVFYETALMQRWSARRYTYGFGQRFPDFMWEAVPWNDVLMRDLGLDGCRKGGSWWREAFEPYRHEDYRGVVGEWLEKRRGGRM